MCHLEISEISGLDQIGAVASDYKKRERMIAEINVYCEHVTMYGAEGPAGYPVCKVQTHASVLTYCIQVLYQASD